MSSAEGTNTPKNNFLMHDKLTVPEVAEATRLSVYEVRRMIRAGKFPGARKTGMGSKTSKILVPRKDVEDYWKHLPLAYDP